MNVVSMGIKLPSWFKLEVIKLEWRTDQVELIKLNQVRTAEWLDGSHFIDYWQKFAK